MEAFNPTLKLVETLDDVHEFLRWLDQRRPVLAIDTETTGLKWWTQDFTRLVQFGDRHTGWALEVRRWGGVVEHVLPEYKRPVVMHNAKFDCHALLPFERAGQGHAKGEHDRSYQYWRVHDTQLLHHLIDPPVRHALKALTQEFVGPEAAAAQSILKAKMAKHKWDWETVPTDLPEYWAYGAADACLTAVAWECMQPAVQSSRELQDAYEVERRVQAVTFEAEERGLRIDQKAAKRLLLSYGKEADKLLAALEEQGLKNPLSNPQVAAALRDQDWTPEEFTPTGKPALNKNVLAGLEDRYPDIVPALTRYRRISKWGSTYLRAFIEDADRDGRLHPSVNTLRARTGRMSITDPALQTLPRGPEIRNCVLPNGDNDALYAIDYDAQELRILAHFSGEQGLMDAISTGQDMHRYVASMVYNTTPEGVTAQQRQITKNVQYGLIYGAGPDKLAEASGTSTQEVAAFLRRYEAEFPGVRGFMRALEGIGRKRLADTGRPFVRTLNGRMSPAEPNKIYKLVNYLIQGVCADLLKNKILELDDKGLADYIVLPVHDELLLSLPEGEEGAQLAKEIHSTMEERELFQVPLVCETTGPLKNWGAKYA